MVAQRRIMSSSLKAKIQILAAAGTLTRKQLADKLGVHYQTITMYVNRLVKAKLIPAPPLQIRQRQPDKSYGYNNCKILATTRDEIIGHYQKMSIDERNRGDWIKILCKNAKRSEMSCRLAIKWGIELGMIQKIENRTKGFVIDMHESVQNAIKLSKRKLTIAQIAATTKLSRASVRRSIVSLQLNNKIVSTPKLRHDNPKFAAMKSGVENELRVSPGLSIVGLRDRTGIKEAYIRRILKILVEEGKVIRGRSIGKGSQHSTKMNMVVL